MKRRSVQLSYLVLINQVIWRCGLATFNVLLEKLCRLLCSFTAVIVFGMQCVPSCFAPLLLQSVQQQTKTKFGKIAVFSILQEKQTWNQKAFEKTMLRNKFL